MRLFFMLLPLMVLYETVLLFCYYSLSWKEAILSASLAWGVLIFVITEGLSLINGITFGGVLTAWGIAGLGFLVGNIILKWRKIEKPIMSLDKTGDRKAFYLWFTILALILVTTGVSALLYPSNNWDSMTYHMARVAHWVQNHHVNFYPTHNVRQLYQPVWAEYVILNFQILTGSDLFANLVQWLFFIGSLVAVWQIAGMLGANDYGKIFAVCFAATLPMGLLQAVSTQNDYVLSFWVLIAAYFTLKFIKEPKWTTAFGLGGSMGLACLTKATAYIYLFPFVLWIVLSLAKSMKGSVAIKLMVAGLIVLAINAGYYIRNYQVFKNPFGSESYSNQHFGISTTFSNLVRNVSIHLGTPFNRINQQEEKMIRGIHGFFNLDPDDPNTTWPGTKFEMIKPTRSENHDGNLFHFLLILVFLLTLFKNLVTNKTALYYTIAIALGFFLFCFYLKWQPWNSRLHFPLFLVMAPVMGFLGSQIKKPVTTFLIASMFLLALPWLFKNSLHPLNDVKILQLERSRKYFICRDILDIPYHDTAKYLLSLKPRSVGLLINEDSWEYPFWVLLNKIDSRTSNSMTIRNNFVKNLSAKAKPEGTINDALPEYILVENIAENIKITEEYFPVFKNSPIIIYKRKGI